MNTCTALDMASALEALGCPPETTGEAAAMLRAQHAEIVRLQRIIDTRPAVNLALVEKYIEWSAGIYESEIAHAMGLDS